MEINHPPVSKARRTTGTVLIFLVGLILIFSSGLKLAQFAPAVAQMNHWGFEGKVMFVGIGELLIAILFLVPATRSIGVLLASSYLGAAVATHIEHGEAAKMLPPAIILSLAWLGAWLRHPQLLWSMGASDHSRTPAADKNYRTSALPEI